MDITRYDEIFYVADFRNFHVPFNPNTESIIMPNNEEPKIPAKKGFLKSVISDVVNPVKNLVQSTLKLPINYGEDIPVILRLQQNIIPIHIIKCKMCEFDIESLSNYTSLSTSDFNEAKYSFKVKVGNYTEELLNPILNTTNINNSINTYNRSKKIDSKSFMYDSIIDYYIDNYKISQNIPDNVKLDHMSGTYFNMNSGIYDNPNKENATAYWLRNNAMFGDNSMLGNWVNNAVDFGLGYGKNYIKDKLDSLKMKEIIPGISFNTITAAIAAQDIVGIVGLVRKGVKNTQEGFSANPSERLDDIDNAFKQILSDYTKETVSATEKPIQDYAKLVLENESEYNKLINSEQYKLFETEGGMELYERLTWNTLKMINGGKSATENKIVSYMGPSTE
ncbi:MAG: hypothetical protein RSC92_05415 [Clostridia bacterium]